MLRYSGRDVKRLRLCCGRREGFNLFSLTADADVHRRQLFPKKVKTRHLRIEVKASIKFHLLADEMNLRGEKTARIWTVDDKFKSAGNIFLY